MRRYLVAGNWKMNLGPTAALKLGRDVRDRLRAIALRGDVLICPPFVSLAVVHDVIKESPLQLGAQNCATAESGAFTGEVSAKMLAEAGARAVIVAHSERRQYQRETDEDFVAKINLALRAHLTAVFCYGEVLEDRHTDRHQKVVRAQLEGVLPHLAGASADNLVLAYEPVWAIGTGETATPEMAQHMHAFSRQVATDLLGRDLAGRIRILYGGSVKPDNAMGLFSQPDIDGGLVGGASLDAGAFVGIVQGAEAALNRDQRRASPSR
jgi:triosephosphate isomerase